MNIESMIELKKQELELQNNAFAFNIIRKQIKALEGIKRRENGIKN